MIAVFIKYRMQLITKFISDIPTKISSRLKLERLNYMYLLYLGIYLGKNMMYQTADL